MIRAGFSLLAFLLRGRRSRLSNPISGSVSFLRLHSNSVRGLHFFGAFGSNKRINWGNFDTFILACEGEVKETRCIRDKAGGVLSFS
jgi:hypothetical protein